jgi:hypothetical protein
MNEPTWRHSIQQVPPFDPPHGDAVFPAGWGRLNPGKRKAFENCAIVCEVRVAMIVGILQEAGKRACMNSHSNRLVVILYFNGEHPAPKQREQSREDGGSLTPRSKLSHQRTPPT